MTTLYVAAVVLGLCTPIYLNLVAPRLKRARETQTIEVEIVIPEPERDFCLIRPDELSAFILGERMRLAFKLRQPKPVDEFTTRLEWAFAIEKEEVRS